MKKNEFLFGEPSDTMEFEDNVVILDPKSLEIVRTQRKDGSLMGTKESPQIQIRIGKGQIALINPANVANDCPEQSIFMLNGNPIKGKDAKVGNVLQFNPVCKFTKALKGKWVCIE